MAPKVGVAGVAPEVGEKAPLCTPLCTPLSQTPVYEFTTPVYEFTDTGIRVQTPVYEFTDTGSASHLQFWVT